MTRRLNRALVLVGALCLLVPVGVFGYQLLVTSHLRSVGGYPYIPVAFGLLGIPCLVVGLLFAVIDFLREHT